jgi:acylphosphatase
MAGSFDKIVLVRVGGRVQRVGYRAWTEGQAGARGLFGWVRNRANGDVEALFAGSAIVVDAMIAACWRGPSNAEVGSVDVETADETLLARRGGAIFAVLPTE